MPPKFSKRWSSIASRSAAKRETKSEASRIKSAACPRASYVAWDVDLILSGAVMVGPPGSGKTTTAAKIAAQVSAQTRSSQWARGDVGMISTDTHRPGGAALLLAYADALDVYATSAASALDLQNRVTQWNRRWDEGE